MDRRAFLKLALMSGGVVALPGSLRSGSGRSTPQRRVARSSVAVRELDDRLVLSNEAGDWIVWTREGYYAATPGGERMMGWTVSNGLDRAATFHPAAKR